MEQGTLMYTSWTLANLFVEIVRLHFSVDLRDDVVQGLLDALLLDLSARVDCRMLHFSYGIGRHWLAERNVRLLLDAERGGFLEWRGRGRLTTVILKRRALPVFLFLLLLLGLLLLGAARVYFRLSGLLKVCIHLARWLVGGFLSEAFVRSIIRRRRRRRRQQQLIGG